MNEVFRLFEDNFKKLQNCNLVRRYGVQKIEPATALSAEEMSALAQEGINFMGIEIDFIVS